MTVENTPPSRRRGHWSRNFPPLIVVATALAMLALILPNALRVPQQDPSPVMEYAPVPPNDDEPPNPPPGNFNSLALGSSSTLTEGAPPPPPKGSGDDPPGKACVGKKGDRRQTEDPMAPQCVPFFSGDNGGATWTGVSKDEIRVVVYMDTGNYADESSYDEGIYDVDTIPAPACPKNTSGNDPKQCAHVMVRVVRSLANFFNDRFQTYGRRVHFWVQFTSSGDAKNRRIDAARQLDEIPGKPFSGFDEAVFNGYNEEYVDAAAARGMLVFSSNVTSHTSAFYQRNAPLAWGFWPDVEHWADLYVSYVCKKVAPYPVSHSGAAGGAGGFNGQRRVFGLFHTSDAKEVGLQRFYNLVKAGLNKCGVEVAAQGTFPQSRFIVNNSDAGDEQTQAIAQFQQAGVTTVLYLGGVEGKFTQLADAQKYYPEIVVAGDLYNDNIGNARLQNQNVWKNAWAMSYQLREDRRSEQPGYRAARDGDPNLDEDAAGFAADSYRDFFMLFQGIQVAGPKLNPENINKGFHALPERTSDSPYVASCFFDPDDYSCVKDAQEVWWDTTGHPQASNTPGCWRMVRGGERFLAGKWEGADDVFGATSQAPCNGRGGTYQTSLGAP